MTALLADTAITSPVLPRRLDRVGDRSHLAPVSTDLSTWVHRAPSEARAVVVAPQPAGYRLTDRGIAVILALIVLVVGAMAATLLTAYLSVSNEPTPVAMVAAAPVQAAQA